MHKSFNYFVFFLLGALQFAQAQEKLVTGTVLDETATPLPGASVVVKGTSTGVSTDFDGNYGIRVSVNDILVVSYIGYISQEVVVGAGTTINVTLEPSVSNLDEVVVMAYGTQKREAITSSVATVNAEELKDVTTPDVSSMLQGKAAGVQVSASSGAPGAVPDILIRGAASLNGSIVPLWVVDGVIQHTAPVLNPNDVASISVLKDASATSLYGSRGANGVIIVTTKRGQTGKGEITIGTRVAMNQFNTGNFEVMDSQQLYDYHTQFANSQPWFSPELLGRDYDWIEGGTQTGIVKDHTISFTAGGEKLSLFISGGIYTETGTIKGTELDRYTYRMNLDYQMTDKLKIMPKLSFSFDENDHQAQHPTYELYLNLPWDIPFDDEGNPVNAQESSNWLGRDQRNYFYDLQWNYSSNKTFNMSANFDVEYQLLPNLLYRSTNNFTLYDYRSKSYTDPRSISGEATNGSLSEYAARRFTRLSTQMLEYRIDFGIHSLTALAGYEYNDYEYEDFGATGQGLIAGSEVMDVTTEPGSINGFMNDYALQSFFGAADYAYSNRYFAKASLRRDGASNFGLDNQYGIFYAFGAGWNIHNEDFFNTGAINELKLRASYGSVGNRPSSLYPYQGTYRLNTQYNAIPAAVLDQFGNPDLGWEKSYETNLALDTRIFNTVGATFEYYNKNTSDLLYFVNLPDITGFNGYWENVGGLKNSGFEVALSADIVQTENFNWNLGFNIGVNKNEITELFDGQTEIPRGTKIFKVGEDSNSWYIRKWIGVDPANGDPLWEVRGPDTGEITQTNNWNEATLQIAGTSTPDYIGGFNTGITYKNLSLNANFNFSKGGTIYNSSRELFDSDGFYPTFNQQVLDNGWTRWENPGDIATHPRPVEGGNNNSNKPSSRYLEDASYLRMRNVTLSYSLSTETLKRLGMGSMNLYISGDNLFTITDYTGVDPAVAGLSGSASLSYPIPKRIVMGLNLSF
jgi:TonB-linked SusC/RagA family outer membrane protein